MTTSQLKIGAVYKHHKGKHYKAIGIVRHSETLEELVLYEALYENELGKMWVRPKEMFLEEIEVEGQKVKRFKLMD